MFCKECGKEIPDSAIVCMGCGVPTSNKSTLSKSRLTYILLGIFLGSLGIHNFYAGYTGRAIAQLSISLLLGWLIIPIFAVIIWALIEICIIDKDATGIYFT